MKVLALANGKGGCGKSTLAIHLAVGFTKAGYQTALLDTDSQSSSCEWADRRGGEAPFVVPTHANRLSKQIEAVRSAGGDICIIDCPPHNGEALAMAARSADLVFAPSRPAIMDLNALTGTMLNMSGVRAPIFVVLNAVPVWKTYGDAAEKALVERGISVCPVRIGNRVLFQNAITEGKSAQEVDPESVAAYEIEQLYQFAVQHVGGFTQ